MSFEVILTPEAEGQYQQLRAVAFHAEQSRLSKGVAKSTKSEGLFKQLFKCIELLSANPRHPGLQTHTYHALRNPYDPKGKVFEAYIQHRTPGAYRLFWCYGPGKNQITILAITPHP
jgi:hypothetical protein